MPVYVGFLICGSWRLHRCNTFAARQAIDRTGVLGAEGTYPTPCSHRFSENTSMRPRLS